MIFAWAYIPTVRRQSVTTEEHVVVVSRWAILRFVLGIAQITGATMTLGFLLSTGVSVWAWWSVSGTGMISLTSILLFRVLKVGGFQK